MAVIKTIGKLAPGAYKQMIDHLTRKKIKNPFIDAEDIVVNKKPEVETMEAINAFIRRNPKADGGMLVKPSVDGRRPGYAKISKISRDLKQTPTSKFISVEKQKIVDDVLEQLVKEGKTSFEKVSEVIEKIAAKGMGKTTARTGIENSKFLSQFEFLGPGAGLDKEILKSDWFKRNYPNATTIEEASGKHSKKITLFF